LSIGIKIENINSKNVNPAKNPIKSNIMKMTIKFEVKNITNTDKIQEMIKRITITNNRDFFDKFLSPEINLIIYTLNSVLFKISV
jgi:secreted Zn-dependent insulinase-like peptidase